jgi:hypothetical protein
MGFPQEPEVELTDRRSQQPHGHSGAVR